MTGAAPNWTIGTASLDATLSLLAEVFPDSTKFRDERFLSWQYLSNPAGSAVALDAVVDARSLGHYCVLPQAWTDGERLAKLFLSLNTATSEVLRGQGVFIKLAEAVYREVTLRVANAAGIVGVPNRNSASGFVKRLGWTLRSELDGHSEANFR